MAKTAFIDKLEREVKGEAQPNLSSKTDSELLVIIGRKTDDRAVVREAWAELHRRTVDYLFKVCRRAAAPLGQLQDQLAEDTVCEVFRHLYEHAAERFVPRMFETADEDRRYVRAWLGTVATRVTQTEIRKRARRNESNVDNHFWEQFLDGDRTTTNPEATKVVRHVLSNLLDDNEREVVATKMRWWPTRLPSDVLQTLATKLGIKKDSIRKVYERAIKKVEDALEREGLAPKEKAKT